MRKLFGVLAVVLGAISIALAARYGYKGADTMVDGVISAVVFGAIALCAFLFDAAAVRLWFMGHRIASVAIALLATAALVVTFTNNLGAIASRADTTLAERSRSPAPSTTFVHRRKRKATKPSYETCRASHERGIAQAALLSAGCHWSETSSKHSCSSSSPFRISSSSASRFRGSTILTFLFSMASL